jgi:hypothetical protein
MDGLHLMDQNWSQLLTLKITSFDPTGRNEDSKLHIAVAFHVHLKARAVMRDYPV